MDIPARMFSTALATMKFLSETSPIIGFSSFLGTAAFFSTGRWNCVSIEGETLNNSLWQGKIEFLYSQRDIEVSQICYLLSGSTIVPVPFLRKSVVVGFKAPLG